MVRITTRLTNMGARQRPITPKQTREKYDTYRINHHGHIPVMWSHTSRVRDPAYRLLLLRRTGDAWRIRMGGTAHDTSGYCDHHRRRTRSTITNMGLRPHFFARIPLNLVHPAGAPWLELRAKHPRPQAGRKQTYKKGRRPQAGANARRATRLCRVVILL